MPLGLDKLRSSSPRSLLSFSSGLTEPSSPKYQIAGNEFSQFGLSGKSFSSILDSVGKWHNDYQDYLLTAIVSQKQSLEDTIKLKQFIKIKSSEFFYKKGINSNMNLYTNGFNYMPIEISFNKSKYSIEGNEILEKLKSLLINYNNIDATDFFYDLKKLKTSAL